jgi:hypothetical protein
MQGGRGDSHLGRRGRAVRAPSISCLALPHAVALPIIMMTLMQLLHRAVIIDRGQSVSKEHSQSLFSFVCSGILRLQSI